MSLAYLPEMTPSEETISLSEDQDVKDAVAMGGMDAREIGERLGVSRQAVEMTILRALDKLKLNCERMGLNFEDLLPAMKRSNHND